MNIEQGTSKRENVTRIVLLLKDKHNIDLLFNLMNDLDVILTNFKEKNLFVY